MEHTVIITSKLITPKDGKHNYITEGREVITEQDIEELALKKYAERIHTDDERAYAASVETTVH